MKWHLLAVGQRLPDWAEAAYEDYAKRFPPEVRVHLRTVKAEPRTSGKPVEALMAAERQRLEAALPKGARLVVLDERGDRCTTAALAQRLRQWQLDGIDVAFVIGGPDGLDPALREAAHWRLRLSDMTLPHALARVLLIEQLYRAWSLNTGHPYHRE
ncbi:MAG: 23S rRNA (pseudouridine(1915)-N(3))-methyltransferase RlmH [Tepidimonas taiwanensis]|nr:23S rRNA (pseudouridine(1915)-N(3))-methyltransferase RlmH [Tepidimonas taiwanensis]MDM7462091.1 23S rRNA (pseudouridine(1915)-N(3))-methyltransferase RlmH [Tepidimonas taiwanensis]